MDSEITLRDVLQARLRIAPYLRPTPVIDSQALAQALGCRAVLKCENLNPTRAFKVRGGVNLLAALSRADRQRGVLAVSTGNHAQSVAYAARLFGVRALIFMPEKVNPRKLAAVQALGAQVELGGVDFDAARLRAEVHARDCGMRYVHSSNEPLLIAGVGTCALELLMDAPALTHLVVPLGGGSGVLGAAVVARAVDPSIRVIGVQAEGAPAVYESWRQGRYFQTDNVRTFADGLATRQPFELPLRLLPRLVDDIMLVSDGWLEEAIRLILASTGQLAEGAGAAAVAAVMERPAEFAGATVGLILSGGNLADHDFDRIFTNP